MRRAAIPMRFSAVLLALALPLCLYAVPAASACAYTPIVTVGGASWPSPGLYLEQDCYFVPGASTLTIEYQGTPLVPGTCTFVPAVFVLGTQVPGTGRNHCTPALGTDVLTSSSSATTGAYPDVGVVASDGSGGCCYVSTFYVNWACATLGDSGWIALPNGDQLRVACTVS